MQNLGLPGQVFFEDTMTSKYKLVMTGSITEMLPMTCISLGRGAKEANLYTEIAEVINAYGIK